MIAEQIRSFRKEKRINQAEFAKMIGVSSAAVSMWEKGGNIEKNKLPILKEILEGKPPQLQENEMVYYTKNNNATEGKRN